MRHVRYACVLDRTLLTVDSPALLTNTGCGHCKHLKPEYEKAAQILKDRKVNAILGAIDATDESLSELTSKYGVQGFPTIKVFK